MKGSERALLSAAVAVLLAGSLFDLYEFNKQGATSSSSSIVSTFLTTGFVTGTSVDRASDTFFTGQCGPTGGGGEFEIRVVSDSTGTPVSGETINAIDTAQCTIGGVLETQVVHSENFSAGQGGWLVPIFPYPSQVGFDLNFTVGYQGRTYNFAIDDAWPPIGIKCATLHVPSGNVTSANVMSPSCVQG
jgi:hypothetical protein